MELDFGVALADRAKEPEIVDASQVPQAVREMPAINPPPPPVKLDIRPVALAVLPYEEICLALLKAAQNLTVTDEASYKIAVSQVAETKRLIKELDLSYRGFVTPYNNHVAAMRNLYKRLTEHLKSTDEILRQKMKAQLQKEKLERQRKEAEQREANRRLQERLDAEAKAQREQAATVIQEAQEKLEQETDPDARATLERTIAEENVVLETPAPVVAPVAIEKPTITRTAEGAAFTKDKWKCRITNPDLVPRQYCAPVQKLLDADVKAGVRQIDGCEITEELELNVKI